MIPNFLSQNWRLPRRSFLRGCGGTLALPLLEAMAPSVARAAAAGGKPVRRLVCIGTPFGMYPEGFFPKDEGVACTLSPALQPLERHRGRFTVFSNLDHGLKGGHGTVHTFLSGIKRLDANGHEAKNITLDQRAAEFVGADTRFPSLTTGVGGGCEMSWTRTGVHVPPSTSSRALFRLLFTRDTPAALAAHARRHGVQGSILDTVNGEANALRGRLGRRDQEKVDEYLTSVRDVEKRLRMDAQWLDRPKPAVDRKEPADADFVESLPVFLDLIRLALLTDSTRVATLELPPTFDTGDLNLQHGYHSYSHHGKAEDNVRGLQVIESFFMTELARFMDGLQAAAEPDGSGTLLDHTSVLFGSGMGNGSNHTNSNLPVLLAGGGFKHTGHRVLPAEERKRVPLCNLYLSLLQRFGLPLDRFNTSTGTLSGLA